MRTLIVKLGALGDVARTTPLLRLLPGEIVWITSPAALPLLPRRRLAAALTPDRAAGLRGRRFDLAVCLDEDARAAALAAAVRAEARVGVYPAPDGSLRYTEDSAGWFDMGLISRLGRERADRLKKANTLSYQEHLFAMFGARFSGEEYALAPFARQPRPRGSGPLIGLDERSGARWLMKRWSGYRELARGLAAAGCRVMFFRQRGALRDFAADIAACDAVVCGDTLTLHLALGLRRPVVGLFTCTSPAEIFGYGRLIKVVSPLWKRHFYGRRWDPAPGRAIAARTVQAVVSRALRG